MTAPAACDICGRPTPQDEDRSVHLKVVRQAGKEAHILHRWYHPECTDYIVEARGRWQARQEATSGDTLSRAGAADVTTEQERNTR